MSRTVRTTPDYPRIPVRQPFRRTAVRTSLRSQGVLT